jgi:hypothetical protein
MQSPRPIRVLVLALLVLAAVPAYAAFTVYSGPTTTTLPTFLTAAGAPAPAAVDWSTWSAQGNAPGLTTFAFANMGGIVVSTPNGGDYTFDGIADGAQTTWNMSGPTFKMVFPGDPLRTLQFGAFPAALRVFAFEIGSSTNTAITIRVKTATASESSYTVANTNSLLPNTSFVGVIADESITYIAIDSPVLSGDLVVGDILTREGGAPPPPPTEPPPGGETPEASTLVMIGSSLYLLSRIRRGGLTWLRDGVA